MIFTNTSNILGYQGENLAREITFTIDESLNDCIIYLEFVKPDGTKYMTENVVTSPYLVPYSLLNEEGYLKAQLVAYRGETFIQKSAIKSFYIADSINASQTIEEDNLSVINELITEVANSINDLDFTFDNETKILTTTLYFNDNDTETKTVEINIDSGDKYITNVSIDYGNEVMIFTFNDGTTISCDISPLIDMYTSDNITLKLENGVFSLSDTYKNKIDNANKVEASEINGNIKIDNVETRVYELPNNVVTDNAYVHTDNNFTTEYKEQIDSNTIARHTHINKTILDNTNASFTNEWKEQTENDITNLENEIGGESDLTTNTEYQTRETANGDFFIDGSSSTLHKVKGKSVKFNQLTVNGNFVDNTHWLNLGSVLTVNNNEGIITVNDTTAALYQSYQRKNGHKCLYCFSAKNSNTTMRVRISNSFGGGDIMGSQSTEWQFISSFFTNNRDVTIAYPRVYLDTCNAGDICEIKNVMLFDLTEIYGAGNEPTTIEAFKNAYPNNYYEYDSGSIKHSHFAGLNEYDNQDILQDSFTFIDTELKGINTVKDELNFDTNKKITRIGSRIYQSGDETDSTVLTDGTITYYELETPIENDFVFNDNTARAFVNGKEEIINSNTNYNALTTQEQSYPATIISAIANLEKNKIDTIEGKGLSTNDYTNEAKTKLDTLGYIGTLTGTTENPIYFQDLEAGNYILNGRYRPYEDAGITGNATNQLIQVTRSSSKVNVFMNDISSEELECYEVQISTNAYVRTTIPIPEINLIKMPVDDAMDGIYAQLPHQLRYENSVEQTTMIDISFPADMPNNYCSKLVFKTGSTIPSFNISGTVKWLGDSISNNQLILQANKIYTIDFEKDVFELVARVEMR